MTAIFPIVSNKMNASTQSAGLSSVRKNVQHASSEPSFGAKVIELKDGGKAFNLFSRVGNDLNSAHQRLISGVTAYFTQPFFDLGNKKVDEETRYVSCARTLGKITAGMTTGFLIRWGCIEGMKKFTKNAVTEAELAEKAKIKGKQFTPKTSFTKMEQLLLPKNLAEGTSFAEIKKYRGAAGTFAAVAIMIFTNFLVDTPLTMYLTNKFTKFFTGVEPRKLPDNKDKGGK